MKKLLALTLTLVMALSLWLPAAGLAEQKVSITWLHHFAEDGMIGWVEKVVDEFMELYPECEVIAEAVGADSYDQLLKTKIASDDAPMIFDMMNGRTGLVEFYEAGHLYMLDDMECIDNIVEAVLPEGQYDGHQAAVPIDQLGYCAFYNKDIFEELGLEVPMTLTAFYDVLEKLKAAGYTPITSPYGESWCIVCALYPILYSHIDTDANPLFWTQKMTRETRFSDDEAYKAGIAQFLKLCDYTEEDPFGTSSASSYYKLANGEAAIFINGSWVLDGASSLNPDINLGSFALPIDDGGEPKLMMASGSLLCLYNSDDELEMDYGKKLYNYIYSQDSGLYYAQIAKRITGVKDVDLSSYENLNEIMTYPRTFSIAGKNTFSAEFSTYYQDCLSTAILDYMNGSTTAVEDLCKSLDEGFDDIAGI